MKNLLKYSAFEMKSSKLINYSADVHQVCMHLSVPIAQQATEAEHRFVLPSSINQWCIQELLAEIKSFPCLLYLQAWVLSDHTKHITRTENMTWHRPRARVLWSLQHHCLHPPKYSCRPWIMVTRAELEAYTSSGKSSRTCNLPSLRIRLLCRTEIITSKFQVLVESSRPH
jgi:hypothetical protein